MKLRNQYHAQEGQGLQQLAPTAQERVSKTALKKKRENNVLVLMLYKLHRLAGH